MISYKHKLFLIIAKWIPVVIATGIFLNNTLAVLNIENIFTYLLDVIFGNSISFVITMLACSYAFNFCNWHRIIILYGLLAIILNILMIYTDIGNTSDRILLIYHYTLALIFINIAYYVYKKNKIKNIKSNE